MTALQRVGVSFTATQKDQIKALVESGKTMEAQKLMLREFNKEFGGSATAAGKTLPGQLKILKEQFNNLAGEIVGGLVPSLQKMVTWVSANADTIGRVLKTAFRVLGETIKTAIDIGVGFGKWAKDNQTVVVALAGALGGLVVALKAYEVGTKAAAAAQVILNAAVLTNPYVAAAVAIVALAGALTALYFKNEQVRATVNAVAADIRQTLMPLIQTATAFWNTFGSTITTVAGIAARFSLSVAYQQILGIITPIRVVADLLRGDWSAAWKHAKLPVENLVKTIRIVLDPLAGFVGGVLREVAGAISGAAGAAQAAGARFGAGIRDGIAGALSGLLGLARGALSGILGVIRDVAAQRKVRPRVGRGDHDRDLEGCAGAARLAARPDRRCAERDLESVKSVLGSAPRPRCGRTRWETVGAGDRGRFPRWDEVDVPPGQRVARRPHRTGPVDGCHVDRRGQFRPGGRRAHLDGQRDRPRERAFGERPDRGGLHRVAPQGWPKRRPGLGGRQASARASLARLA